MKNIIKQMKYFIITASIIIVFASCSDKNTDKIGPVNKINVIIASPSTQQGGIIFTASGQIEATKYSNIGSQMMGYVSNINVNIGDKVKKGQLLIQINNTKIKAKKAQADAGLSQVKSGLKIAEKDYFRFKKLHEQNSASQKEFDDITTQYEIAKAKVEVAAQIQNEINAILSYSNIKAPFSGIITSKTVNVGDMVNPGMTLFRLETPGKYVATALVTETEIDDIHKGQKVDVYVKSSGTLLEGIVSEVSISSQYSGGQFLVKISVNNNNKVKLYSGMYVSTNFQLKNNTNNNVYIPKSSLIYWGQLKGIYTVSKSNTAILRWLKIGKSIGNQVEVLSGLSSNEKYIVSTEGKLYNGVKLSIK